MRIKQSVVLPIMHDMQKPVEPLLREIRSIGFAAVEFWGRDGVKDFPAVFESARSLGLVIASMGGHNGLSDGLNNPKNHDRIEAELHASIDLAAQFAIPGIICFSGNRNPGQSDLEGLAACAQGLQRIAPYAQEKSVNLNLELLNSRINHPGYQADHSDWGNLLCDMVNSPRVKLLFDIYHMQIMEGDLLRTITKSIAHIGHFHTAGNPGRNDLDDSQEINYRAICRAIAATPYDLYLGHEFQPKADLLPALRQAFTICDQS